MDVFKFDSTERSCVYPFYKSSCNFKWKVTLLLIGDEEKWHYICIKKLTGVLRKFNNSTFLCPNCYKQMYRESEFHKHSLICESAGNIVEEMPKDPVMKFKNFKNRQRNAVTIYAGMCYISL